MSQPAGGSPRTAPAAAPAAFEPSGSIDARAGAAMSVVPALVCAAVRPSSDVTSMRPPVASSQRAAPDPDGDVRSASASRARGQTPQQHAFNGMSQRARSREAGERAARGAGDRRVDTEVHHAPTGLAPAKSTLQGTRGAGKVAPSGGSKAAASARVSVML